MNNNRFYFVEMEELLVCCGVSLQYTNWYVCFSYWIRIVMFIGLCRNDRDMSSFSMLLEITVKFNNESSFFVSYTISKNRKKKSLAIFHAKTFIKTHFRILIRNH